MTLQKPRRKTIPNRDRLQVLQVLQVLIPKELRERLDKVRDGRRPGPIVREALERFLDERAFMEGCSPSSFDYLYKGDA